MSERHISRRRLLGGVGTALAVGVAGCGGTSGSGTNGSSANATGTGSENATTSAAATEGNRTSAADATAGEEDVYTQLYESVVGSIVLLRTPEGSQGSGWLYDGEHVVTNHHVIAGADAVSVQFSQGESVRGRVVGTDPRADLGVVRVGSKPDYADPLDLAESEPPVGTKVAVVGSPYGLQGSLTTGVVSGVDRLVPSPAESDYRIPNGIQTDAAVNPGNSGGPLVGLDGTVLGVVNSGGGENIAFAISAPLTRKVVAALVDEGRYSHPTLGLTLLPVTDVVAEANGLDRTRGLLVARVAEGSPAAGTLQPATGTEQVAGFEVPVGGDVILAVGGEQVSTRQEFSEYLELQTTPGETVTLTVLRDGERRDVEVEAGALPAL
ncbi:S1C family serine protease [Halobium salinum]|uniref:S1C family serine protease n=1 Tax=Halobium salinum TaxID=1364940 RepID=A0ABD5PCA3_9EURY|nr:trypsin-like peptidase domain-containing protein [Halobium salinum]